MISGVRYFESSVFRDDRGDFVKLFSSNWLEIDAWFLQEVFYTSSRRGVVRGMHLQTGEWENWRLVSVLEGSMFDVLVDLREGSSTLNQLSCRTLDARGLTSVLIPPGVAHGFQALNDCVTLYMSSKVHNHENDLGINISTLAIDWPMPITGMSDRDKNLPLKKNW